MLSSSVYIESHPRRSTVFVSRMNLRDAAPATTSYSVCKLVTLEAPTDACIPFLFNRSPFLRLRRRPTGSYVSRLFSSPCEHFSSQQGGTPPSPPHRAPISILLSPEITQTREIRPSRTSPLSFFTRHESPITDHKSFEATDLTRRASLPTMTAARASESQRRGVNTQ
jgi:hypothetical protein